MTVPFIAFLPALCDDKKMNYPVFHE